MRALFPASDDSAHVKGQEIFVDGGSTASPAGAPIYLGERPAAKILKVAFEVRV